MNENAMKALVGTRELSENKDDSCQIKYYRTEVSSSSDNAETIFGVSLQKCSAKEEKSAVTDCMSINLTNKREQIDQIINKLIANSVTPAGFFDVIDNIYDGTTM